MGPYYLPCLFYCGLQDLIKKDKKDRKEERGKAKKKYLLSFTQVVPQKEAQLYNCEIPHFSNY